MSFTLATRRCFGPVTEPETELGQLQLKGAFRESQLQPQLWLKQLGQRQVNLSVARAELDACQTLLKRHTHVQAWLFRVSLTHTLTHTYTHTNTHSETALSALQL